LTVRNCLPLSLIPRCCDEVLRREFGHGAATCWAQYSDSRPPSQSRLHRVRPAPMLRRPSALDRFSVIALSVLRWWSFRREASPSVPPQMKRIVMWTRSHDGKLASDNSLWANSISLAENGQRLCQRQNARRLKVALGLVGQKWRLIRLAHGAILNSHRMTGHPVVCLTWSDAQDYVHWLSENTGKKYRLPSESEWEYAARAGSETAYPWGAGASHEYANYGADNWGGLASGRDKWVNTSPVDSFPPNAFGLHDMHGNVLQWLQDCFAPDYSALPPTALLTKEMCD
jgi:sulfatase-modifying factor enzyme 1